MHFSINGISVYRFKEPTRWFIWFVQRPAAHVIALMASLVLFVLSPLCWFDAMFRNGSAYLFALVFMSAVFLMAAFISIRTKRRKLLEGKYREFYITIDDYSFHLLFFQRLMSYSKLSDEALVDLLGDRSIIEADRTIRSLGFEYPEELRVRRVEQLRVINLVQAAYVSASTETPHKVLNKLQQQRLLVTSMTNHMAHDRLDRLDSQRHSLMELINETETAV